jgi:hypothetical protein
VIPVTEMGIDTRTPMGKAMDHGAVLGIPRSMPDDVVARIVRERAEGKTTYAICPRPEQGRCADCAGCARLVASHGPRAADAGTPGSQGANS